MKHILPLIAAVALLASCAIQQQKNTVRLSEIETSIVAPSSPTWISAMSG